MTDSAVMVEKLEQIERDVRWAREEAQKAQKASASAKNVMYAVGLLCVLFFAVCVVMFGNISADAPAAQGCGERDPLCLFKQPNT